MTIPDAVPSDTSDADPFADESLTEPEPLSAEDARLLAMEDEAADYAERGEG